TWHAAVVPGAGDLDFRAVRALDSHTAWLMSSGTGAKSRIYRTDDGGQHWSLLYTNPDAGGFFDALAFWDARRGVVLGDPVDGHFVVLTTQDGGQTWQRRKLPPALVDEGAFAASNSCLAVRAGSEMWFGTGGPSGARVFHSGDGGVHWDVTATPVRHDSAAAGIFSFSFGDSAREVVVGGDYGKPADSLGSVAITSDGGRTWSEPAGPHPGGYRSAVAYLPFRKLWVAVGTSGTDTSSDGGQKWIPFDNGAYNAIGVTGGDAAWAVGPGGRIGKLQWP
ncbi:MAG: glycosyl hydrolase, partial [Bryobacteraceae bacterium]